MKALTSADVGGIGEHPEGFLEEMVLEQNSSTRVNQVEGGVWEER